MEALAGPYEILDLEDGGVLETRILSWELGEVKIYPLAKPEGKIITALRIQVPPQDKRFFPYWWDITSQTLVAQLLPALEQPRFETRTYKITKHGVAPMARFTLEVR